MGGGLAKSLRKKDILIIGLDNAGKTTLFKQLEGQLKVAQEEIETTPTIGCNNEQVGYKGLKLNVVDMGGRDSSRNLWAHHYPTTDAVIFVIDSTDASRFDEVKHEVQSMCGEELQPHCVLLFFANKQDVPGATDVATLASKLALEDICNGRSWQIQGASTLNANGLPQGLDWLSGALKKQPKTKKKPTATPSNT
jgi:ADP-ribosylation factor protein 1